MATVRWRQVTPDRYESFDWRWVIVRDNPTQFSVRDYVHEQWLDEVFASLDAAQRHCEQVDDADMVGFAYSHRRHLQHVAAQTQRHADADREA